MCELLFRQAALTNVGSRELRRPRGVGVLSVSKLNCAILSQYAPAAVDLARVKIFSCILYWDCKGRLPVSLDILHDLLQRLLLLLIYHPRNRRRHQLQHPLTGCSIAQCRLHFFVHLPNARRLELGLLGLLVLDGLVCHTWEPLDLFDFVTTLSRLNLIVWFSTRLEFAFSEVLIDGWRVLTLLKNALSELYSLNHAGRTGVV